MSVGQLILVSAPSGAGKTSLVEAMLKHDPRLVVSISHTTRPKRASESDGINYHFVDSQTFETMVSRGEFLEHARVFDHQYGTSKAQVDTLCAAGKNVILEIDWQGADQVRRQMPEATSIFILPPSVEVLRKRLVARGQDSTTVIARRLAEAKLEMSQAHRYQYIVINDDFEVALADILSILRAIRLTSTVQIANNDAVKAILSAP